MLRILEKINQIDQTYRIAEEKNLIDSFDLEDYLLVDYVNLVYLEYLKILTYQSHQNYAVQLVNDYLNLHPNKEISVSLEALVACESFEALTSHPVYKIIPPSIKYQAKIRFYANQLIEEYFNYLDQQLSLMDLTESSKNLVLGTIRDKQNNCHDWEIYPGEDYVYAPLDSLK